MKIIYFIAIDKNVKIYLKVIFLWSYIFLDLTLNFS